MPTGVKVDRAGNIYVGATVRPTNHRLPADLESDLSTPGELNAKVFYEFFYGSVVKFGPSGGRILVTNPPFPEFPLPRCRVGWDPGRPQYLCCRAYVAQFEPCDIVGAQWVLPGLSPMINRNANSPFGGPRCCCLTPRFDLDPYDRLFMPDGVYGRIVVADSNGNLIRTIGSRGYTPSSLQFRWLERIDVSDDYCYALDLQNNVDVQIQLCYTQIGEAQFTK